MKSAGELRYSSPSAYVPCPSSEKGHQFSSPPLKWW